MVLVKHEGAGVVLNVETRGRLTRYTLEVVGASGEEREATGRALSTYAELLATRQCRSRAAMRS